MSVFLTSPSGDMATMINMAVFGCGSFFFCFVCFFRGFVHFTFGLLHGP